jgi:predicted dehydrogenase
MSSAPLRAGIIGCGTISGIYLKNGPRFADYDIVACADLNMASAEARAAEYGITAMSVADLLAAPDIDIIINLTIPAAHAEVAFKAIEAGKHVYNEKPLTISLDDGRKLVSAAAAKGVRVGGAPDTFLGGGIQTCRKLIDDGWIGTPVAASAFMLSPGHESWHPSPEFYYQVGGGPMFDMGPYYLTALITLLGPVASVSGSTRMTYPTRTITSKPKYGQTVNVEVPTHVVGVLDFASGPIVTLVTSFDVYYHHMPNIEIYGSHGSMQVPDPNTFGGPIKVRRVGDAEWREVPLTHGYSDNSRGVGVADMAHAIRTNQPHRASGELTLHVLELMHAIHTASSERRHVPTINGCPRPAPLPLDLLPGSIG